MRIAYLSTDFGVPVHGTKGASVHLRQMVQALSGRGHEVIVLTPDPAPPGREPPRVVSLPFAAVPAALHESLKNEELARGNRLAKDLRNLFYCLWLEGAALELLRGFRPDFLYERYALFGVAGLELARRLGVPLVLEVNAPLVEEQREQRGLALPEVAVAAQRLVFAGADELAVVSRWLAGYAQEHGAAAERVSVIPNATDPELFRPRPGPSAIRGRLGWDDAIVLGFIGAMKPWHGVPVLIQALKSLGAPAAPFRLLLVGDGPALPAAREEVRALGLEPAVHMPGAVQHDSVPEWLAASDIALIPYEASAAPYFSPVKLFECMSMGLPVVAARSGQTEEILVHGRTGWLYAPGESDQPAATIRQVAANLAAARKVGEAARSCVLERHTWDHNAGRVEELARRALARRRPAGARA